MAVSRKALGIAAIRLEAGKQPGANTGWGGSASAQTLGAGNAIPHTGFDPGGKTASWKDDTISGNGFEDLPILTQKYAEGAISGDVTYLGLDALMYWLFGWERPGTSPVSLGGGYYSHLFELDARDRHMAAYRASPNEQTAGDYNALDRKNRMATIARARGVNDHRYKNAMCKKFKFASKAGGPLTWSADFVAYGEERGDYSSSAWTFATGLAGTTNIVMHHQFVVSIGAPGALAAIGVSDFEINVDIPLVYDQDNTTGTALLEPYFEGKYTVTGGLTVSRYAADTYLAARDAYTAYCLKLVASSGSYGFEIYLPDIRLEDAQPSGDNVARLPLKFVLGADTNAGQPFTTEITGHTLVQEGNLFIVTKNQNSTNEMRRE